MKTKILFLLPYPLHLAPSQRFRVEAFFEKLQKSGFLIENHVFLNKRAWTILYKKGALLQKVWAVTIGFLKRFFIVMFKASAYDFIFVHREAAPLGPPVFEWLLAKVFRKKLIYDFDDAIWIPAVSENNRLARSVKCFWKIKYLCKWAYKVSAGNAYLAAYAYQYNANVLVVPTCVDTENRFNRIKLAHTSKPLIGWTGSHSTLKYLDAVVPALQKLEAEYDFNFLVICDQQPSLPLRNLRFLQWKEHSEIEDLLHLDIGLMPLENDVWSEGKCGFKIIQYLALGIPAVVSPVGVNKTIIDEGKNGFFCNNEREWIEAITILLTDEALRQKLGKSGREKIVAAYSIKANASKFLSLFS